MSDRHLLPHYPGAKLLVTHRAILLLRLHCIVSSYRRLQKNTPHRKRGCVEDKLSEDQIRGWRAVSAAGLQGDSSRARSVSLSLSLSQTPVPHAAIQVDGEQVQYWQGPRLSIRLARRGAATFAAALEDAASFSTENFIDFGQPRARSSFFRGEIPSNKENHQKISPWKIFVEHSAVVGYRRSYITLRFAKAAFQTKTSRPIHVVRLRQESARVEPSNPPILTSPTLSKSKCA